METAGKVLQNQVPESVSPDSSCFSVASLRSLLSRVNWYWSRNPLLLWVVHQGSGTGCGVPRGLASEHTSVMVLDVC